MKHLLNARLGRGAFWGTLVFCTFPDRPLVAKVAEGDRHGSTFEITSIPYGGTESNTPARPSGGSAPVEGAERDFRLWREAKTLPKDAPAATPPGEGSAPLPPDETPMASSSPAPRISLFSPEERQQVVTTYQRQLKGAGVDVEPAALREAVDSLLDQLDVGDREFVHRQYAAPAAVPIPEVPLVTVPPPRRRLLNAVDSPVAGRGVFRGNGARGATPNRPRPSLATPNFTFKEGVPFAPSKVRSVPGLILEVPLKAGDRIPGGGRAQFKVESDGSLRLSLGRTSVTVLATNATGELSGGRLRVNRTGDEKRGDLISVSGGNIRTTVYGTDGKAQGAFNAGRGDTAYVPGAANASLQTWAYSGAGGVIAPPRGDTPSSPTKDANGTVTKDGSVDVVRSSNPDIRDLQGYAGNNKIYAFGDDGKFARFDLNTKGLNVTYGGEKVDAAKTVAAAQQQIRGEQQKAVEAVEAARKLADLDGRLERLGERAGTAELKGQLEALKSDLDALRKLDGAKNIAEYELAKQAGEYQLQKVGKIAEAIKNNEETKRQEEELSSFEAGEGFKAEAKQPTKEDPAKAPPKDAEAPKREPAEEQVATAPASAPAPATP